MQIDIMAGLGVLDCFHAAPEGVVQGIGRIAKGTSGSGKALRASRIMPAGPFIVKRLGFSQGEVKDGDTCETSETSMLSTTVEVADSMNLEVFCQS